MRGMVGRQRYEARPVAFSAVTVAECRAHALRIDPARRWLHDQAAENVDTQMAELAIEQSRKTRAITEIIHQPDRHHARTRRLLQCFDGIDAAGIDMRTRVNVVVHRADEQLGAGSA